MFTEGHFDSAIDRPRLAGENGCGDDPAWNDDTIDGTGRVSGRKLPLTDWIMA